MDEQKKWVRKRMTHVQTIALGFFLVILTGTLLLMLPVSARDGRMTSFLDSFFTAVSATCVTGLVVVDTFSHWSWTGQAIILLLVQIGGMGFMTIGVVFFTFFRKKISLNERGILQESMNVAKIGGIVRLARRTAAGVIFVEAAGAVLLSIRFIPQFGLGRGIWYSVFHSISAFCNAGLDLMGYKAKYTSFTGYSGDLLVNVTLMLLIIIGGIGFVVWDDVVKNKWHVKKYMLHTKMAVSFTLLLLVIGSVLFYLMEKDHLMQGMPLSEKILSSVFCSVTPRTAGFNTINTADLSNGSKLLTAVLMFIGGSPGSTAGGIKTVTLLVLICYVWSNIRSLGQCKIYKRRIGDDAIKNACNVLCISLFLAVSALVAICALQPQLAMSDVIFEVFSAIGTSGMSTGVTRQLGPAARIVIIILMYCGRLGSMSFAMAFASSKKNVSVKYPVERVMIG